jgi:hypothetical protein
MHTTSDIPTIEPTVINAGTTIKWTKDLSDHYDPASWTLAYFINGPAHASIAATSSGTLFAVTIPASTTATWIAGIYTWESRVTKGTETFSIGKGTFEVKADVTVLPDGYDPRSQAKRILDAHLSAYEAYAGRIESQYSINAAGRSFVYEKKADLISAIQFWQAQVAQETMAEKIARGENTGRNILVRFK